MASIGYKKKGEISTAHTSSRRLISIDALRGFDMFWIAGGGEIVHAINRIPGVDFANFLETQLNHVDWEGMTFYDLIFPLFIYIVGVSLVFSLSRIIEKNGKASAYTRLLRRSILLFMIGVVLSTGPVASLNDIRLMGVLQRIALCYLFAGLIFCALKPRGIGIAFAALLLGYWALMTFVSVPGEGAGNYEEGANLANYIDRQYLPLRKYDVDHDPEGLLSTLPAIATCLMGVFTGHLLKNNDVPGQDKAKRLTLIGVVAILLGLLWGIQFPVIKKIWTSSYVLVSGGLSCIFLAIFYQVIEIWGFRKWVAPFVWIGMNSIAIYIVSSFLSAALPFVFDYFNGAFRIFGSLVSSLTFVGLILIIAYILYQRKIFLRF
jgi:predicted acyltransferase